MVHFSDEICMNYHPQTKAVRDEELHALLCSSWWSNQIPVLLESNFCYGLPQVLLMLHHLRRGHICSNTWFWCSEPEENPRSPFHTEMSTCQKQKGKKKKKNVSLHHAPTASSARPHPTACGWIVVSWRWTWSIRSINRDYCNPRGQKEGTGPLRVHTTSTSSGQIWARMANIRAQEAAISPKEWTHQTLTSILH